MTHPARIGGEETGETRFTLQEQEAVGEGGRGPMNGNWLIASESSRRMLYHFALRSPPHP